MASLEGHTDLVLALDVLEGVAAGSGSGGSGTRTLLLSGAKDNSMRLWEVPGGRCLGESWMCIQGMWEGARRGRCLWADLRMVLGFG